MTEVRVQGETTRGGTNPEDMAPTAVRDAVCVLTMAAYAVVLVAVLVLAPLLLLLRCPWWLTALAAAWTAYDWDTCNSGGVGARRRLRLRAWLVRQGHTWWGRALLAYLPVRVVVEAGARFDPRRSYVLCGHPHGVLQHAATLALFGSPRLAEALAGLQLLIATKPSCFLLPVARDFLLSLGLISCSEQSLRRCLRLPGKAVFLMPGSAQESLRLRSDSNHFYLKRRGFCRVALAEGASLVPMLVLGENRCYRLLLQDALRWLHDRTGLRLVLPMGRGVLQDYVGVLPRREPVTVVVGAPLDVEQTASPTRPQVEALHAAFVDAVKQLYAAHAAAHYKEHSPLVVET